MIDVSVIIPSWNAKKYLQGCVNSIIKETKHCSIEIIVVDNASTDGSPEMIQNQFPQLKLIRNSDNFGFAKACNIGMRQAEGNYFCILNSDVTIKEECIDNMFSYMEKHPEIGVLGPKILGSDGNVQRSCMGFPSLWNSLCRAFALDTIFPDTKLFSGMLMTYWPHDTIRSVDVINGCLWLVRSKAVQKVGLLDEDFFMYSEDKDWCKRFHESGWQVVFFPEAKAIHFGGVSSSNAPIRFSIEYIKANLQYWEKHTNFISRFFFKVIFLLHYIIRTIPYLIMYLFLFTKRGILYNKIKRNFACIHWLLKSYFITEKQQSI